MVTSEELQRELQSFLQSVSWNITGIKTEDNQIIPIPPESKVVTAILQALAAPKIIAWAKTRRIKVEDLVKEARGYPDFELSGGSLEGKLVALDVKSARYISTDVVSRMTLGTYDGYFLHPAEKRLRGGRRCYNDYDEHWVAAFIYKWNPEKKTPNMVEIVERIVAYKWQIASRTSGSGDTANIGGLNSLSALRTLKSEFHSEDEFERYWRQYAIEHPRKRTRVPKTY